MFVGQIAAGVKSFLSVALLAGALVLTVEQGPVKAARVVTLCPAETVVNAESAAEEGASEKLKSRDCQFRSLSEAVAALRDGDRLEIAAGDYREAARLTANGVTIAAAEGAALRDTAYDGKAALLILGNDTVIEGLECSGIQVPAQNGACIRLRGRNLTLRNVYFHDSQQGLLSGGEVGEVIIEDSRFERLGAVGRAHAIYMSDGDHLIVRRSRILSSKDEGHEIKSRARRTTIEDNEIGSLLGQDSRAIDLPNGGEITIRNNIIQKGPNSLNPDLIGIALEKSVEPHAVSWVIVTGNTLILDRPGRLMHSLIPVQMTDNEIVSGSPRSGNNWHPDRTAAGLPPMPELARVVVQDLRAGAGSLETVVDQLGKAKGRYTELANNGDVLTWRGRPLVLTSPETSIVTLLSSQPGETASFSDLYKLIEPDEQPGLSSAKERQSVVLGTIKTLRRKFRDVDQSFSAVAFKPGKGFVWDEGR